MTTPPPPITPDAQLSYALGWFSHHATQRLQTFNFYIVVVTVLLVGYGDAIQDERRWFAALLCGVGLFVTILLFQLEVRNAELVSVGQRALAELEKSASIVKISESAEQRTMLGGALTECWRPLRRRAACDPARAKWRWRQAVARHGFVLRFLMLAGALLFLAGFMLAAAGVAPRGATP